MARHKISQSAGVVLKQDGRRAEERLPLSATDGNGHVPWARVGDGGQRLGRARAAQARTETEGIVAFKVTVVVCAPVAGPAGVFKRPRWIGVWNIPTATHRIGLGLFETRLGASLAQPTGVAPSRGRRCTGLGAGYVTPRPAPKACCPSRRSFPERPYLRVDDSRPRRQRKTPSHRGRGPVLC